MALTLQSADQLLSLISSLVLMRYLKGIDQTNTTFLITIRLIYFISISLQLFILYIIKQRILSRKDTRTVKIKKVKSFFAEEEDEDDEVTMTYAEYDMQEFEKVSKQMMIQAGFTIVMHFYWAICQPIILQGVTLLKMAFFSPLFLAYIRNKDVERPFEKNMLFKAKEVKVAEKKKKEE